MGRRGSALPVFILMVGLGSFFAIGSSLYFDKYGDVIQGEVFMKTEDIPTSPGSLGCIDMQRRVFTVTASYHPPGEVIPIFADIQVSQRDYDRLRVHSRILIRYLELRHSIARLANQTTATWLTDVGLKSPSVTSQETPLADVMTSFPAIARITRINLVGQSCLWRLKLKFPYQRVEYTFIPSSLGDVVLAADKIDPGSGGKLSVGTLVKILYNGMQPRGATLVDATRMFVDRNKTW